MSGNVGSVTIGSGMVENVGVTIDISLATALFHESAIILAAILISGSVA